MSGGTLYTSAERPGGQILGGTLYTTTPAQSIPRNRRNETQKHKIHARNELSALQISVVARAFSVHACGFLNGFNPVPYILFFIVSD